MRSIVTRSVLSAVVLAALAPAAAGADVQRTRPAAGPFATAKGFVCTFPIFGAARWGDIPEVINGTQDFSFRIERIDYKKNQAIVVGDASVPVTVRLAETGFNVIEQTPIGNFILTTIFSAGGQGKTYRAAHSRHIGDVNDVPRTSQSYGTCDLVD